jgi:hypothetical protein
LRWRMNTLLKSNNWTKHSRARRSVWQMSSTTWEIATTCLKSNTTGYALNEKSMKRTSRKTSSNSEQPFPISLLIRLESKLIWTTKWQAKNRNYKKKKKQFRENSTSSRLALRQRSMRSPARRSMKSKEWRCSLAKMEQLPKEDRKKRNRNWRRNTVKKLKKTKKCSIKKGRSWLRRLNSSQKL